MKAMIVKDEFGLDALTLTERETPAPGPGQVLLSMRAASLNYRDLLMVRGHYNPRQRLPLIPASDGVGEVIALGPGVTRVAVGDRVCPIFVQSWLAGEPTRDALKTTLGGPLDGTLTQQMVVDAESVVRVPEYLTDAEAACLPCAAVTAWSALVTHGRVTAGDFVLTLGTGGVSIFALQIAKLIGARVMITSSSADKLERARALGADETANYREDSDWGKTARSLSSGEGVDHVIEVGGGQTLAQSLKAIRPGGTISIIGVLAGASTDTSLLPVLMQNVRLQGVIVGHRESFEAMNRAFALHHVRPVVDRVFPLSETRAALEHMAAGDHFGKICIDLTAA